MAYFNLQCKKCGKIVRMRIGRNKLYCSRSCHDKNISGKNNPHWRGGKMIVGGYKYIYNPNHPFATKYGYVLEHRLIMEKYFKRYLAKEEIVHHINHNKLDNRLKNLILIGSFSAHSKIHFSDRPRNKKGQFN